MRTPYLRSVLTASALLFTVTGYSAGLPPEVPIETTELTLKNAHVGGSLLVRPCKDCEMLSLKIDANSQAFFHGKPVSISSIPEHNSSAVTVIYDPNSKVVKRVRW
jgi:hypothetical protein